MSLKTVDEELRKRLDDYMFDNYGAFFPSGTDEVEIVGKDYLFFINDDPFYVPRKEVDGK